MKLDRIVSFCAMGVFALALFSGAAFAQESALPGGNAAQRLTLAGIDNFARVNSVLYRGAQPKDFAFNELKNIGVAVVVNFRNEKDEIASEKRQVESLGMQYVSLPWTGTGEPTHDEVLTFLNLMRNTQGKKVFVHCKEGRDRTGTMVALYRLTFNHWNTEQALMEMHEFKYHAFLLPGLARYVRAYPSALQSDPTIATLAVSVAAIASTTVQ